MRGPLSRFNNMDLWNHRSFADFDVLDCTLSKDWSDFSFSLILVDLSQAEELIFETMLEEKQKILSQLQI